jgi:hypothetical protein
MKSTNIPIVDRENALVLISGTLQNHSDTLNESTRTRLRELLGVGGQIVVASKQVN